MATERTVRTTGRNTTIAMALTAVFLAAFVGALLLILRAPAPARPLGPATHPAAPTAVIAPAQQGAMGSTATHRSATPAFSQRARQFVDEGAGAGAQGVEPASLTGPLPERLQDLDRPTAPAGAVPQARRGGSNRFFADEMAAGSGLAYTTVVEPPSAPSQSGPR